MLSLAELLTAVVFVQQSLLATSITVLSDYQEFKVADVASEPVK